MGSLGNILAQITAVTRLNVSTIKERRGASIAAVVGVAGVVAVLVAVLSIAEGFRMTMRTHGGDDTAIVVRSGSDTEMTSILTRDDANIISQAPGVATNAQGPIASPELFVVVDVPKRSTGTEANVPLRGVSPQAFAVRGKIKIVRGRMFETGKNEVIVGEGAEHEFAGLEVGSTEHWGRSEWKVVGVFSTDGTVSDSEIWCDEGVLRPVYRRGNTYQSVHVRLTSPAAFTTFKDALTSDPRLNVKVERESAYYADQSRALVNVITGLGTLIAALMAVGAVFGALNTMYTAVAARTREIATLRALGFRGTPVVLSVLAESLLLALAGGVIGGLIAYLAFNGYQTATLNWQSFSQITFAFRVTPRLLVKGIVWALAMGILGGLFPAIRAARMPVATALREL